MEVAELLRACEHVVACAGQYRRGEFTGDELMSATLAVEQLHNAASWLSGELLEDLHNSGAWTQDGSYSAANWVASHSGGDRRDLSMRMRTARRLRQIVEAARLSPSHQRDLAHCAEQPADLVARDGAMLVELAEDLPAREFRVAAQAWRSAADDEGR